MANHPEIRAPFALWKKGIEAAMLHHEGKDEEALRTVNDVIVMPLGKDTNGDRMRSYIQAIKGLILLSLGGTDEAGTFVEAAYSAALRDGRRLPISQVTVTYAYARWLVATGQADKAKELLKWRIEAISRDFGPTHPELYRLAQEYSAILEKGGDTGEAKLAEARLAEIERRRDGIRERIQSDPLCVLPWE